VELPIQDCGDRAVLPWWLLGTWRLPTHLTAERLRIVYERTVA
jgi:hypothetical protein